MDSYGKKAGKGPLIQEEKSATLGVSQDQYLFQPMLLDDQGGQQISVIKDDISPTLRAQTHGHPPVVCYEVEMEVAKRKHEVDIERLKALLRSHKTMSNKEIAERLDQPLTLVEHWFRADRYFAIPQPEIWMQLKALLGIETDEFDKSIMEFEFIPGNYDMRNRIWGGEIAPTLTQGCDDLMLLPRCYGISSYDSNGMKSSNPHSGIYEATTSRTLDHNGNNPACHQGGILIIENHPADSRVDIDESGTVQTLTSRMGTGGGNVPLVMYSKSHRARSEDDFETWKESEVTNTMNTFDSGDSRATDLVVCGVDLYNQSLTGEQSKCMTNKATDSDHIPCVICMETFHCTCEEDGRTAPLKARDYKDPLIAVYPKTTGSLMASGYNKLGTQEAANDMYVVQKITPGDVKTPE